MATTDAQVEMNRRLYMGQQVGLMGVPIGKSTKPSPIRTRREIVPGLYGRVNVGTSSGKFVGVGLDVMGEAYISSLTAEELREAAHILNQIAEVLEENQ